MCFGWSSLILFCANARAFSVMFSILYSIQKTGKTNVSFLLSSSHFDRGPSALCSEEVRTIHIFFSISCLLFALSIIDTRVKYTHQIAYIMLFDDSTGSANDGAIRVVNQKKARKMNKVSVRFSSCNKWMNRRNETIEWWLYWRRIDLK